MSLRELGEGDRGKEILRSGSLVDQSLSYDKRESAGPKIRKRNWKSK